MNLPGYFYVPGNATGAVPSASLCPADTWSRGLRKQRSCVACFPGFTTGGVTGASASTACCELLGGVCIIHIIHLHDGGGAGCLQLARGPRGSCTCLRSTSVSASFDCWLHIERLAAMSMCGLLACGALCADLSPARMNALGSLKDTQSLCKDNCGFMCDNVYPVPLLMHCSSSVLCAAVPVPFSRLCWLLRACRQRCCHSMPQRYLQVRARSHHQLHKLPGWGHN